MKIIRTVENLRKELTPLRKFGKTISLVPTMGYFHEGHLSLMDIARKSSDIVVVSLFVNPIQFSPNEDLERYPRDFERDEQLAEERGVDIIFYPDVKEIYPEPFYTYVSKENLYNVLCGASRPIHFRGVTTIVAKFFNIVQPDIAVFGQKDAQQAIIIKQMVKDLNFPIKIIIAPIIREKDGLSMSSRNKYLSTEERKQAPIICKALTRVHEEVRLGNKNAKEIEDLIREIISSADLARIEYIGIIDDSTLK
ncbi:MAG: pantoate--beta-alanine ligase, partial [Candidatus Marinimicrobia bacterium]|nr:pantoate--beta-alanine ligase [Candidatus Neomarinimicrobiota bacterium]